MELLRQLIARAPDDPVVLAAAVVAAWLPFCAVGLACLVTLAALQNYLHRRPRGPRMLVMPPPQVRPLVARRTITEHRSTHVLLDVTRLTLAIGAVLAFSALILAASGSTLLTAFGR
jgi:hypothetical protein